MDVFLNKYAACYDAIYESKNYQTECDLIQAALSEYSIGDAKSVLDVGCGTGGHAIELAKRGYKVSGVDKSQAMLEIAENKSINILTSGRPEWICGDIRRFELTPKFDVAIMMFAVIGYLTSNEDVVAGLKNIRKHLKPGGILICDFWNGLSVIANHPADKIKDISVDNRRIIRYSKTTVFRDKQTADVEFQLWILEQEKLVANSVETHKLRFFFPLEFDLICAAAGFELKNLSSFPWLHEPVTCNNWNSLAVCLSVK